MISEITARLKELKEEYHKGQERLAALEQETTNLNNTMLRISGAIQVLAELIGDKEPVNSNIVNTDLEKTKNTEQ